MSEEKNTSEQPKAPSENESETIRQSAVPKAKKSGGCSKTGGLGCVILTAIPVLCILLFMGYRWLGPFDSGVGEEAANEVFSSAMEKIESVEQQAAAKPEPEPYDIDKTIRVLHSMDLALENQGSMKEYLDYIARQDFENVAPEVLEARMGVLEHLKNLYALHGSEQDHEQLWKEYQYSIPAALSLVQISAGVLDPFSFRINKEESRRQLEEMEKKQEDQKKIRKEIRAEQNELYDALVDYSEVYYKYLAEWDELVIYRDRAYLASHEGDWEQAIDAANTAIELNPYEREARIIKAYSLINGYGQERSMEALGVLSDYTDENPDKTAPAMLLEGVIYQETGDFDEARLKLEQAATQYPRQAEYLTEMADPYEMRNYLRKSAEGMRVTELYKTGMLGAGFFSPDLQMARLFFENGDTERGQQKVLDHFSRRRAQGQFDYIVSDLKFAYDYLGVNFFEIFPDDFYLDLNYNRSSFGFGQALNLEVVNRSETTLNNVTLILCIHFTDMVREDYEAISSPKTVPVLPAGETTDFGQLEFDFELFGKQKTVEDIVEARAVLISNEAVIWVDTQPFKEARLKAMKERAERGSLVKTAEELGLGEMLTTENIVKLLKESTVEMDTDYGTFNADFKMPKDLALTKPIFRLKVGGEDVILPPSENKIEDGKIKLNFSKLMMLNDLSNQPIELNVQTRYGDFDLNLTQGDDGKMGVEVKEEQE